MKRKGIYGLLMIVLVALLGFSETLNAKDLYVSIGTGKNKGPGTKEKPFKRLQKAITKAKKGDKIYVAEGNYLGKMKVGFIDLKKKPLSIYGGYSKDFSERDPLKYQTKIQPTPKQNGTSSNRALLEASFSNGDAVIDGMIFDRGYQTAYKVSGNPENRGQPEGVESGMYIKPPGQGGNHGENHVVSVERPVIAGKISKGNLTIQNCIFMNANNYAIQMGINNGKIKILNNLFVNTVKAVTEIYGTSPKNKPITAELECAYNTVLFVWTRTKSFEDMGYGFRCMTGIHNNFHDNIIGGCCFAAIDKTRIGTPKQEEEREIMIDNNIFFLNKKADMTLPSSGGLFMAIRTDMFEELDDVSSAEGNVTLDAKTAPELVKAIDKAYLTGFINATYSEKTSFDPNSPANVIRQALGQNQRGTIKSKVTMFGNYYPLEKALKLVGAVPGKGMQAIK